MFAVQIEILVLAFRIFKNYIVFTSLLIFVLVYIIHLFFLAMSFIVFEILFLFSVEVSPPNSSLPDLRLPPATKIGIPR